MSSATLETKLHRLDRRLEQSIKTAIASALMFGTSRWPVELAGIIRDHRWHHVGAAIDELTTEGKRTDLASVIARLIETDRIGSAGGVGEVVALSSAEVIVGCEAQLAKEIDELTCARGEAIELLEQAERVLGEVSG